MTADELVPLQEDLENEEAQHKFRAVLERVQWQHKYITIGSSLRCRPGCAACRHALLPDVPMHGAS